MVSILPNQYVNQNDVGKTALNGAPTSGANLGKGLKSLVQMLTGKDVDNEIIKALFKLEDKSAVGTKVDVQNNTGVPVDAPKGKG